MGSVIANLIPSLYFHIHIENSLGMRLVYSYTNYIQASSLGLPQLKPWTVVKAWE